MAYLIQSIITFAIPLLIVALAGVFSERSGIINIALDGIMIFGAFIGVFFVKIFVEAGITADMGQILLPIIILLVAVFGALFALLLAFASVHLKADQTIGGTALNLLAPALVLFLVLIICQQNYLSAPSNPSHVSLFMLRYTDFGIPEGQELNLFQQIFCDKIYTTTYYAIGIVIILSIVLYKTKFGLRLRACGENPQAAASLGINVYLMRYIGVAISGALAAFGGFIYALTSANCSATGEVAGMGFLALAVMIFGNWKPLYITLGALLFGSLKAISAGYTAIDINGDGVAWLATLGISKYIYNVLPYIITLVVLAFTSKSSRAPKAEGQPYDKSRR